MFFFFMKLFFFYNLLLEQFLTNSSRKPSIHSHIPKIGLPLFPLFFELHKLIHLSNFGSEHSTHEK